LHDCVCQRELLFRVRRCSAEGRHSCVNSNAVPGQSMHREMQQTLKRHFDTGSMLGSGSQSHVWKAARSFPGFYGTKVRPCWHHTLKPPHQRTKTPGPVKFSRQWNIEIDDRVAEHAGSPRQRCPLADGMVAVLHEKIVETPHPCSSVSV
jgi:hypothetical protein